LMVVVAIAMVLVEAGNDGACETETARTREPHDEHMGCLSCSSHAAATMGHKWRRKNSHLVKCVIW
jgi:hypothetical protein